MEPMASGFKRGSEWAQWDLHIHSPDSIVQSYGVGGVEPWAGFLDDLEALPPQFRAIGINDYLFLDGYRKVREYRKQGRLRNLDLVLPVIELRLSHFGGTEGHLSRINLHVIFSDDLEPDLIQAQFINGLKCDLGLLPEGADPGEWSSLVTRESLISLGATLKNSLPAHLRPASGSDLQAGFNNYNVTFENVTSLLENPVFRNRHFLAIGKAEWADVKWTKQSAAYKKTLINRPHFVFTATETPASFKKSRDALRSSGVNDRLLDCSDAHALSTAPHHATNRIGQCMTWICAIPTFEGLRHAYHEYETRVYVGDAPPKLNSARTHSPNHLDRVMVRPVEGCDPRPCLAIDIALNSGFVAIVGNRGRGKSALTDIIGLLGNSHRGTDFSFLTRTRFRHPRANLAAEHVATLTLLSGSSVERSLDCDPDSAAPDAVQYLPQNFLESVCNEAPGTDELFSKELGDVIFSHVPEAERLGAAGLDELIESMTGATRHKITILRGELSTTISQVLSLEVQLQPQARRALENRLAEKQAELDAHLAARPLEVPPPTDTAEKSEHEQSIEEVRTLISQLETELRSLQATANEKTRLLEMAGELRKELANVEHQVTSAVARLVPVATELGLEITDLLTLTVNTHALEALRAKLVSAREDANRALSITEDGTPARRASEARTELTELEAALDAPQRAYQTYLSQVADWEMQRQVIGGSKDLPDSLEHLKFRLEQLGTAPERLDTLKQKRMEQALAIHSELMDVAGRLRDIHRPVQEFIASHPVVRDRFNLAFQVTIVAREFSDRLLGMINRQVTGSFAGADEAIARLEHLVAAADFDSSDSVRTFLETIDSDLQRDNREGRVGRATILQDQLRKSATPQALYELLFGLDYLNPEFWLESDAKPIAQLSPGQRGTLLLLFYLLVDKSCRPILLDQPEENLDNQTVHELLVPAIAEARRNRQVIAVTHNPNLAVVGDADQVIVAEMTGNRFAYVSGAIEDPDINTRIVSILEGTWPAFQNRRDKYVPTSVLDASSA